MIERTLNLSVTGAGTRMMMFAHGFGCDQNMWRLVAPAFEDNFKTILFDFVGAGESDLGAYDIAKYASLDGYADDVVALATSLDMQGGVFVGHSVSAMIGLIAAQRAPSLFSTLILVTPSPCYFDDGDYIGGFQREQLDELLEFLDSNHLAWSQTMAPMIMANPERPELGAELSASICRTDPDIARRFARVTFLTDSRADLGPTEAEVLILQCRDDVIAPPSVGDYLRRAIHGSTLITLDATGHCPHLSAPEETISAIKAFLRNAEF